MLDHGVNEKLLSKKTGIEINEIKNIATGDKMPTLKNALILSRFFGIAFDLMFTINKDEKPNFYKKDGVVFLT